jgi:hypothetical protein
MDSQAQGKHATEDKRAAQGAPARSAPARSAPARQRQRKKRRKIGWRQLVVAAVALVIVWQVGKSVTSHSGKTENANAGGQSSATPSGPSTVPSSQPAPMPTVTLGGHPVAAGGGPVILVNPGLVSPGGQAAVQGSGFDPGASVTVWLESGHAGKGTVVAHGVTTKYGTLWTAFTLPMGYTGGSATVVAQQAGGKTATVQIQTPIGIGRATIAGKSAGKPGDTVTISASGFGPGEKIDVFWGRVTGIPVATLTADTSGSVGQAKIQVGVAPVGPTTLVLVGERTKTTATAPYIMLGLYPVLTPHPYAVRAGHAVTLTGTGFAPGEQVQIYLNAASGWPALTTSANTAGRLGLGFVVPFGLKGRQTLTAVGEESRAASVSGFTVEPYLPSVQASTYGAMPGTSISFYATGFAANEVVLVYLGGGHGATGKLVTAFRADSRGDAANAGSYVIPNGGGALYFTLVGQESGGTGVAKVAVTAAPAPVNVPPQPPYVLPPSLGGKPTAQPSGANPSGAKPSGANGPAQPSGANPAGG